MAATPAVDALEARLKECVLALGALARSIHAPSTGVSMNRCLQSCAASEVHIRSAATSIKTLREDLMEIDGLLDVITQAGSNIPALREDLVLINQMAGATISDGAAPQQARQFAHSPAPASAWPSARPPASGPRP